MEDYIKSFQVFQPGLVRTHATSSIFLKMGLISGFGWSQFSHRCKLFFVLDHQSVGAALEPILMETQRTGSKVGIGSKPVPEPPWLDRVVHSPPICYLELRQVVL